MCPWAALDNSACCSCDTWCRRPPSHSGGIKLTFLYFSMQIATDIVLRPGDLCQLCPSVSLLPFAFPEARNRALAGLDHI